MNSKQGFKHERNDGPEEQSGSERIVTNVGNAGGIKLVAAESHVQDQLVCGFLSPFHPGGTIASALEPPIPTDTPSLERRIRWAVQMASAVHHLHRVAPRGHQT